jgi:hypothetical protein
MGIESAHWTSVVEPARVYVQEVSGAAHEPLNAELSLWSRIMVWLLLVCVPFVAATVELLCDPRIRVALLACWAGTKAESSMPQRNTRRLASPVPPSAGGVPTR